MKIYADSHISEREFNVGDQVYLKFQDNLLLLLKMFKVIFYKYFGPFTILEKIGQVAQYNPPGVPSLVMSHHEHLKKKKKKISSRHVPSPTLSLTNNECETRILVRLINSICYLLYLIVKLHVRVSCLRVFKKKESYYLLVSFQSLICCKLHKFLPSIIYRLLPPLSSTRKSNSSSLLIPSIDLYHLPTPSPNFQHVKHVIVFFFKFANRSSSGTFLLLFVSCLHQRFCKGGLLVVLVSLFDFILISIQLIRICLILFTYYVSCMFRISGCIVSFVLCSRATTSPYALFYVFKICMSYYQ